MISYTYDAWGRLDIVSDNFSKYDFDYDNLDRVTSIDNNGNPLNVPRTVLTNEYDLLGRRTSLSAGDPAGLADFVNTYSYDAAGRMTSLTQAGQSGGRAVGEKRVDLAYDDLGRIDTITRYEDLLGTELVAQSAYDFDLAGRLTSLAHTAGATLLASYTYNYDRLGRLTKETSSADGVRNYRYDVLGQLTRVHGDATESYSHDATGNRTGEDKENGANNRLLDDGTYTYTYDDNGNRTRKTNKTTGEFQQYYWDHRNRLLGLTFHDANGTRTGILHYRYDVFDQRIARFEDLDGVAGIEGREYYIYDAAPGKGGLSDIVLRYDENSNVTNRYLHGPGIDQVFSDENALNEILWSLADRQGSIENWVEYDEATDTTSVAATIFYDAFGVITSQTPGFEVFYAYTGRIWDGETGLYDFRTRVYDAYAGRFASEDWIGFAGGQANLVVYVGNSPVNFVDPSGLYGEEDWLPSSRQDYHGGRFGPQAIPLGGTDWLPPTPNHRLNEFQSGRFPVWESGPFVPDDVKDVLSPSGDVCVGIEFDGIAPVGMEVGIGGVLDLDTPLDSGLCTTGGAAAGYNVGGAIGAAYTPGDVEGFSTNVDLNVGPGSLQGGRSDSGDYAGGASFGPGFGASTSYTHTGTLSVGDVIDCFKNGIFPPPPIDRSEYPLPPGYDGGFPEY